MLNWLRVWQLPLLFFPAVIIGLVTYGSNFKIMAGYLYIGLLLGLPVIYFLFRKQIVSLTRPPIEKALLMLCALVSLTVYRPLHMGVWDEASLWQAVAVVSLGVLSLLVALSGAGRIAINITSDSEHRWAAPSSLVIIGLLWLPAVDFPLFPLLACGLIGITGLAQTAPAPYPGDLQPIKLESEKTGLLRYALFVGALEAGLVAWDLQGNTRWAFYLALTLVMMAAGILIHRRRSKLLNLLVIVTALLTAMGTILQPHWVLFSWHSAVTGIATGWLVSALMYAVDPTGRSGLAGRAMVGITLPWVFGLFLGMMLYLNLQHLQWRGIFLAPIILGLLWKVRPRGPMARRVAVSSEQTD